MNSNSNNYSTDEALGSKNSRQLEGTIEKTRSRMDDTLDALGEKLNPRHLLDDLLDVFRSKDGQSTSQHVAGSVKTATKSLSDAVVANPIPSLLVGAGAVWWLIEQSSASSAATSEHREWQSDRNNQRNENYLERNSTDQDWNKFPTWHEQHNWKSNHESQADWHKRADKALADFGKDDGTLPSQRLKSAAASVIALSGHKRDDIQRWRGSPKDSSDSTSNLHAQHWNDLSAADTLASDYEGDDDTLAEKATSVWQSIKDSISDASKTTQDKLAAVSSALGGYVSDGGKASWSATSSAGSSIADAASSVGQSIRSSGAAAGHATQQAYSSATKQISHGWEASGQQLSKGYDAAREGVGQAVENYPLAVGAACFGIGLLAGLIVPETQYEDDLMGQSAEEIRRSAKRTVADLAERGKDVASATANAAMSEAEKYGLTAENLKGSAQHLVDDLGNAITEKTSQAKSKTTDVLDSVANVVHAATDKAKAETHSAVDQATGKKQS